MKPVLSGADASGRVNLIRVLGHSIRTVRPLLSQAPQKIETSSEGSGRIANAI